MSASSTLFDRNGAWPHGAAHDIDAMPLTDEALTGEPGMTSSHPMQWLSAAIALALFVLARLDLLPAMPW